MHPCTPAVEEMSLPFSSLASGFAGVLRDFHAAADACFVQDFQSTASAPRQGAFLPAVPWAPKQNSSAPSAGGPLLLACPIRVYFPEGLELLMRLSVEGGASEEAL